MSRRRLATLAALGGLAGSLWTVGFVTVSRAAEPGLTVVGDDDWQIALLEAGTNRILICAGLFESDADPAVRSLLTTMRQHVDVIAATESGLRFLDRSGPLARSLTVQLDAASSQPDTPSFRPLRQQMAIEFPEGLLLLERIPANEWNQANAGEAGWWIRLVIDGLTIVIAPDLSTAARCAPVEAVLVVAPSGNVDHVLRTLPGVAIATNGSTWNSGAEDHVGVPTYLVRTFPADPARFHLGEQRLGLPDWAQKLVPTGE